MRTGDGADSLVVDRMGYMLGVLAASATSAVGKFERFQTVFVDTRPAPAGESWDYDGRGTSPGEGSKVGMSAHDAEIVRRLREGCTDGRFDARSNDDLLRLFQRNKQVLSRGDDDVIAAMTPPQVSDGGLVEQHPAVVTRSRCWPAQSAVSRRSSS